LAQAFLVPSSRHASLIAIMCSLRIGLSSLVALSAPVAASSSTNVFAEHPFYLNPVNQAEYDRSIASAEGATVRSNLQRMRETASAYWIDTKAKIRGNTTRSVQGILADAASKAEKELVVLIWYNFPNRDCAALASAGEICCAYKADGSCDWGRGGDCSGGIAEYKNEYVEPFVEVLAQFKGRVPVAIIFEPDSLPNFATNMDKPHCGTLETQNAYTQGATYALNRLAAATDAAVYIDAAHGGWLGWHDNIMKYMKTLQGLEVDFSKIRGFSTNVAGYEALGHMCPWMPDDPANSPHRNGFCLNGRNAGHACCADGCHLLSQWDSAQNELNYAQELHHAAQAELGMEAHVVIDTGRNGVSDARSHCANWCNIRGAGAGHASTSKTEAPAMVDAYFYLKTPGESDGCTETLPDGTACGRFDGGCDAVDAIGFNPVEPRAPEAGAWFDYQVKQLAELASFGDDADDVPSAPAPVQPSPHTGRPASPVQPSPHTERPAPPVQKKPSPPKPSSQTSAEGTCCWGGCAGNCAPAKGWCAKSEDNCANNCGGTWCPAGKQNRQRRQGRLRASALKADSVLLQKQSQVKRNAKAEIRKEPSSEEL